MVRRIRLRSPLRIVSFCSPDEIDALTSKRQNAHKDMEKRIVSQLISSFDGEYAAETHGELMPVASCRIIYGRLPGSYVVLRKSFSSDVLRKP